MSCINPLWVKNPKTGVGFPAPCGHCLSCKSIRRAQWSLRLAHEIPYHDYSYFITLTYDDDHLPINRSLWPRHLQNHFKCLRKAGINLKYYACGEYGSTTKTFRPHYHYILFTDTRCDNALVSRYWPHGLVKVLPCETPSIQYVTGYVRKKVTSFHNSYYSDRGVRPPFQLSSQGLGSQWAKDHASRIISDPVLHLSGKPVGIPRYYVDKVGISDALKLESQLGKELELKQILDTRKHELSKDFLDTIKDYDIQDTAYVLFCVKRELRLYEYAQRVDNYFLNLLPKDQLL